MSMTSRDYCKATFEEMIVPHTYLEIFAELLGTFLFMTFGMGSAQIWASYPDRMQTGLCFGIAVGAAMTVVQHISGGHLNPAITITQMCFGRIYIIKAIFFILVQIVGCILGAGLVRLSLPNYDSNDGVTQINGISQGQGLMIEVVTGFILIMIWEACTDPGRPEMYPGGPVMIGFTISACIISIMPWTGGSLNPARTTGAAIVMADYKDLWVYWIGPPIGALIGCTVYTFLYRVGSDEENEEEDKS